MIHYTRFASARVSVRWRVVLLAARHDGVRFHINSGYRSMAEQWRLFRQKGRWSPSNPHGAAFPSPNAPHIRVGRAAHALDVDLFHGDGAQGLAKWLRKHGADARFTVPMEPWHLEITEAELRKLWRRYRSKFR